MRGTTRYLMHYATALGMTLALATAAGAQPAPDGANGRERPRHPAMHARGPVLSVSGEAEIKADPDHATVRLGALVQAETAGEAQEQVNEIMQEALRAVTRLGVDEKNIQTSDLSLYPVYSDNHRRPPRPMEEDGNDEPRIVGYRASNTITIELSDLNKIGDVIDAAIEAGANQLQGVEFSLRDDADAQARALREAVEAARHKARVLADAAGMGLGELISLKESGTTLRPPMPLRAGRFSAAELAAATPVQPGQITVRAQVDLIYHLRSGGEPATQQN